MGEKGFFPAIHAWLARPFNAGGSALNWTLFVMLIIIAAWFWQSVLLMFLRKSGEVAAAVVEG